MLPGKTYSPRDFVDIARRRWWLLTVPPTLVLFCALIFSSTLPDVYRSDMLIAVVSQRVPDDFVRSTVTLQMQERLSAIQVQIMSRSMLEPIIDEFDLYREERRRLPMEEVLRRLRSSIGIDLQGPQSATSASGATAFRVSFTYTDPEVAARVTQRLGSIFVDQNMRDRGAIAEATDEFLELQLIGARQRLEEHEKRMQVFRQRHGNELPTQLQSNLQAIQNAQLQIQALVEAIARDRDRKLVLERLYQDALNEPVTPAVGTLAQAGQLGPSGLPVGASTAQELAAARAVLAGLESRLTPEHPDVTRTERIIEELERKLEAENTAAAEARRHQELAVKAPPAVTPEEVQRQDRLRQMRTELDSLDRLTASKEASERELRTLVAEYQRRIEAVPGLESEWVALTRDYDTLQSSYRDLLGKSEASKVALDLEARQIGERFRILDPARVPAEPVSPNRLRITTVGIIFGLVLGLGIVALLEIRDASFRTENDVLETLRLPVLAAVPDIETAFERTLRLRRTGGIAVLGVALTSGAVYVFWAMELWKVAL